MIGPVKNETPDPDFAQSLSVLNMRLNESVQQSWETE